ncbi:hypothetical protein TWF694_008398 [Orbilia ellipsospora]|uniref:Uncharacterized protein n=1 Tax=Orbilia ellipsospora TaxID=2528407 RepID=A0AAV9XGH0_9PEZI
MMKKSKKMSKRKRKPTTSSNAAAAATTPSPPNRVPPPLAFFHPRLNRNKYFRRTTKPHLSRLDNYQILSVTKTYLIEKGHTRPYLLALPPRNIAVLIDTCSYIFSKSVTDAFRYDLEALAKDLGERLTMEDGQVYECLVRPMGHWRSYITLEELIEAMVDAVVFDYNRYCEDLEDEAKRIARGEDVVSTRAGWDVEWTKKGVWGFVRRRTIGVVRRVRRS